MARTGRPLRFAFFQASYSPADMVEAGMAAEAAGFDSVLIGDHLLDLSGTVSVDPWTVLSYIAARTKKIGLTTSVTDALRVHPAKLAHMAATLDELSGGRVTLGLGAGESMNLVPFGIEFDPDPAQRTARLREAIQVIRALLDSSQEKKVDFAGRYYRLKDAWMQQRPAQRHLPIGIGALGSKRTLRLIGELGDVWLPAYNTVDLFRERVRVIEDAARKAGRDPAGVERYASILAVLSRDEKTVARAVDAYRGSILSLAPRTVASMGGGRSRIGVDLGYDYQRVVPGDPVISKMDGVVSKVPDEVVKRFMVIGGTDELTEAIDAYRRAGATSVLVWDMVAEGLMNSLPTGVKNMRLIQERVMPHFR